MLISKFKRFKEVSEIWCNNKKEYFIILDNEKYNFDLIALSKSCVYNYLIKMLFEKQIKA